MNPIAAIPLSFLLTAGLVYAAATRRARQAQTRQDRLDRVTGRADAPASAPLGDARADSDARRPDALPTLTRWLGGAGWEPRLRLAMLQADLRLRPGEWAAVCAASWGGGALLGLLATHLFVTGLATGLVGLAVPLLVLPARQAARRGRFDALLPDTLMLLTASLRAGHSFGQAMQAVASELPAPVADEFGWASGEARLGVPLDVALGRMTRRVPSPDLDLVVTAILIQLPLGGNLAEVLDAIADTIRERVRMAGEVQTLTAEGRLSAVVLLVLAPALALLLHLRSPEYFQPLFQTLAGRWMVGGAVLGQIAGGLIIRRMVTLDV